MFQKRIKYALVHGGIFGLLMTLIKGIIHLLNKGFTFEWIKYIFSSGLVFILGSMILYFIGMWPLVQYLDKKSKAQYQKEIEEDYRNQK